MGKTKYALGLDFGTNSVRALIASINEGREAGMAVWEYRTGEHGIVIDRRDPELARQNPFDYLVGIEKSIKGALRSARRIKGFSARDVVGIGIDTTGSTPMPVDRNGKPLAAFKAFAGNPHAMAWLWKDHTAHAEAAEITESATRHRPLFLSKCGGVYSSEWFWSKLLRCRRVAPRVFKSAYTWVEIADWIPAMLTGKDSDSMRRCICAAGHKAMFHRDWGGYPDAEWLEGLDPELARLRRTLPDETHNISAPAGMLTRDWSKRLGLPAGIPVAVGAFDAHLGAVGSGVRPGVLVKIIGTSTCDMTVAPLSCKLPDIPGLCGIVPESILPGCYGLEAGQSAVGDIFNWFAGKIFSGGNVSKNHGKLTREAARSAPGASGLLALDWHNGNRTVLVDQRLTGVLMGLTLHSTPAEIYRALIEATAFGARVIMERFEEYGVKIRRIVNCGGISAKNTMIMQIYADVMNRSLETSRCTQTCALGAAIAGAVVAGRQGGGHAGFTSAMRAMTGTLPAKFRPAPRRAKVYNELYVLYRKLHDSFGVKGYHTSGEGYEVMKELLSIRDRQVRGGNK